MACICMARACPAPLGTWRRCRRVLAAGLRLSAVSVAGTSIPDTTTKTLICPGWKTAVVPVSQPGTPVRDKRVPFCPGSGNRDRRGPFVPVGNTNQDKRCSQRPRGWRTLLSRLVLPTGTKCPFFFLFFFSQFFFYFNYTFAFQLNLCIGIQCV